MNEKGLAVLTGWAKGASLLGRVNRLVGRAGTAGQLLPGPEPSRLNTLPAGTDSCGPAGPC